MDRKDKEILRIQTENMLLKKKIARLREKCIDLKDDIPKERSLPGNYATFNMD